MIPGVPETVRRAVIVELVGDLLCLPVDELISFTLGAECIEAEFYARNPAGTRYYDALLDKVATHKITIPIVD